MPTLSDSGHLGFYARCNSGSATVDHRYENVKQIDETFVLGSVASAVSVASMGPFFEWGIQMKMRASVLKIAPAF
jgi:hypothetical protein